MAETDSTPAYLSVSGFTRQFPGADRRSVDDVSFTLKRGQMLTLLGPSGCGKTTLLRMIAGLTPVDSGQLHVAGRQMTETPLHARNMGMVFQSYALFPHLSVARNISFGLDVRGIKGEESRRRVAELVSLMHLTGLENRRITELSGGQRQRVALARALAIEPDILMLDEPLANLDIRLRDTVRTEIRALQQRLGITAIFVTHDQDEALSIADQVAVMSEGRLQQFGTPADLYTRPANRFVASFVGRSNFIEAVWVDSKRIHAEGIGTLFIGFSEGWKGRRTLLIRPHRIRLGNSLETCCQGVVENVVYTGERRTYLVRVGYVTLTVEQQEDQGQPAQMGDIVDLYWQASDMSVLQEPVSDALTSGHPSS
ncbi:ABC transporter ATP-binding protein [Gluconobacter cerinus]|uniref:ABC transporter ATP-binding protein n=1 Tax=Gluconobacter cerinus TaxID=38307 RepID=UPI001B8BBE32|nr:ABC transporter ATP-binding protein [Gluconobacter cerinus]MBS1039035.1 ABC transporter ATP-binding protein [Gluconobacter cerinus]MBS1045522.1 ABC transporter ATP-binding protein [Gluconobacter cerinus]